MPQNQYTHRKFCTYLYSYMNALIFTFIYSTSLFLKSYFSGPISCLKRTYVNVFKIFSRKNLLTTLLLLQRQQTKINVYFIRMEIDEYKRKTSI